MINFEDWKKIELRVVKVISAEKVLNSNKLLKIIVSLGSENRQIIAGIGNSYEPEYLVNKQIIIVANLIPKLIMGLESQGMIVATEGLNDQPIFITPEKEAKIGSFLE